MAISRLRRVRMVQDSDSGVAERDVSEQEYQQRVDASGVAYRLATLDQPNIVVIYDQVDGTPFKIQQGSATQTYLRKTVSICTSCRYASVYLQDVREHIEGTRQQAKDHAGAEIVDIVTPSGAGKQCSGCGVQFFSRPRAAYEHLERMLSGAEQHRGAEIKDIRKYGLEPPVLEQVATTPVVVESEGPHASVADRSQRPRRRRRRRGRGGKDGGQ